jgi:hypothetical protein
MASAAPQAWPLGYPDITPFVVLGVLVLTLAAIAVGAWPRRRAEAPLREQMRARPMVHFRARVHVRVSVLGLWVNANGALNLIVRGDAFEVSNSSPLARILFGQEYCYRAGDTTIEVIPGLLHEWIEIRGRSAGPAARIQVWRRKLNRQIWDALVRAGAHPAGAGPGA